MINDAPIKEAVWETILCCALDKAQCAYDYKSGSHCSGQDIMIKSATNEAFGVSCKSCKETRTSLVLSSYRLTTCKTIEDFTKEIDIVRANFRYYAIIGRVEHSDSVSYNIYMIPAELIKAANKEWVVKYKRNKQGDDHNNISQWDTISQDGVQMSIKAAMSNQLWITLSKEHFAQYCVCKDIVVKNKKIIDYCGLFDKLSLVDESSSTSS
jgi:hypothetical protein